MGPKLRGDYEGPLECGDDDEEAALVDLCDNEPLTAHDVGADPTTGELG